MRSKLATSSYASVELQQPMEVETIATSKLVFGEERGDEEPMLAPHESKLFFLSTFFRSMELHYCLVAFFTDIVHPLP